MKYSKGKKLFGILLIVSISMMIVLSIISGLSGEFARASNLKLILVLFGFSVTFSGIYLIQNHCPTTKPSIKILVSLFGLALAFLNTATVYNVLPFVKLYNWLISGTIIFILLVQLQLLNWGNQERLIMKLLSVILVLANLALIVFFIAKWSFPELNLLINISILTGLASFILGLIFSKNNSTLNS